MTYNGETLLDGLTLADYSIPKESTLLLLPSTPLSLSTTTIAPFVLGAPISGSVLATGGFGFFGDPLSFAVTAGSLPTGVVLDPATGALTGTPTTVGAWSFTITASAGGVNATQSFSGVIAPQLAATGGDPAALIGAAGLLLFLGVQLSMRGHRSGSRPRHESASPVRA